MSLQLRLLSVLVLVAGNSRDRWLRPTLSLELFCGDLRTKSNSGKKEDATRSESEAREGFLDLLRTCSVSEIRKPTADQHLDDSKNNRGRDTEH